jgi:hypothetical protein
MTLLTIIYVWTADPGRSSAGRSLTVSLDAQRLARFLILLASCFLDIRDFLAVFYRVQMINTLRPAGGESIAYS